MNRDELINLLALAQPGVSAENLSDGEIREQITNAFQIRYPEQYQEIAAFEKDTPEREYKETLLTVAKECYEKVNTGTGDIDTNPVEDTNAEPQVKMDKGITAIPKTTSGKRDATKMLSASVDSFMPKESLDAVESAVKGRLATWKENNDKTTVTAFLIDTSIREYLKGKTFKVDGEDAVAKFKEKYPESKLPEKDEANKAAYKDIIDKLVRHDEFTVNVPKATSQKIIGIALKVSGAENEEQFVPINALPQLLLTKYGAKITNGRIQVGLLKYTEKTKRLSDGTIQPQGEYNAVIQYKGKPQAMQDDGENPSQYVKATSIELTEDEAEKKYASRKRKCRVRSNDSFKYYKTDADKEAGKLTTAYVRGEIEAPYYERMEPYLKAGFDEVKVGSRLHALTVNDTADILNLLKTQMKIAYDKEGSSAVAGLAAALDCQEILEALEKSAATPNAANED